MEQEVTVLEEGTECEVDIELEPFSLSNTQSKTVSLDMIDGDQVVFPDSGFLLQSVRIQKPEDLEPDNIVEGKNIGGVPGSFKGKILPELSRPAESVNVFYGYEYIDQNGEKRTGQYHFPVMSNAASPEDVFQGRQYLDQDGIRQTGTFQYPSMETPAEDTDVFLGKEYLDPNGQKRTGSFSYPQLENPTLNNQVFQGKEYIDQNGQKQVGTFSFKLTRHATVMDVVTGKRFWDENGERQLGELDPNSWINDMVRFYRQEVTVGANSVNTTLGVRDYLIDAVGTNVNRLLAFGLHEKPSYQIGEIGRAIIYQNSSIGYFTVAQYTSSGWGTGRMLSGYSAVLPEGSVYDVFYWSI